MRVLWSPRGGRLRGASIPNRGLHRKVKQCEEPKESMVPGGAGWNLEAVGLE